MPGRRFWILAASVGLTLSGVAADSAPAPTAPANQAAKPDVPGLSGQSFSYEENGKVLVAVNASFSSNGAFLAAKLIKLDTRTGLITADGDVVYATPNLRILGEQAQLDPKNDLIVATKVRFGRNPVYLTADELRIEKGDKTIKGLRMWHNEPAAAGMSLNVGSARYTEKDDWLALRDVRPQLAGLPFLYIPYYGQEGYPDIPYEVYLNMGSKDRQGTYLRTTTLARQTPSLWVGALLDFYSKSGFLVGPYLKYDNAKDKQATTRWKGFFQAGYISDRGDLLADGFGRTPGRTRAFEYGEINGRTADGIQIAGQLFATSDPDFVRDFRPNLSDRTGTPQLNLEVTKPWNGGLLSANIVAKADNYQEVAQKLPEVRFDLTETALGDQGLRQRGFAALAYLNEQPAALASPTNAWSTARLDVYYGLARTFTAGDWLTWKPVVGIRATDWTSALNGLGNRSKVMGQVGFDVEGLATGSWDLVAKKWSINGMRHTVRPVLQYRYLPGAEQGYGELPMSDASVALSAFRELDLADRPDAASVNARQTARFGFRNTLATRDTENGTRDLLRFDVFTNWEQDAVTGTGNKSDVQAHLSLTPAPWVSIDTYQRLPNGGGPAYESLNSISFNSGDFWKASFGWYQLRQAEAANQLWVTGEIRLNSVYSGVLSVNYDALTHQSIYQSIGLVQRIGNSWEMEYGFQKRVSTYGDSALGFHLRARLFKF
jgi:LPS-assembly protein